MSAWTKKHSSSEDRFEMFEELITMMTSKELQGPSFQMIKFGNYQEALENALNLSGMVGKKYIFDFQ